jgi:digeranylgeranylglycerophospholipid reductase
VVFDLILDNDYDVIVVGAGPGGSATARKCAELGLKTALIEKRAEIGAPKRCAEGLSSSSIAAIGQKIPDYCITQTIDGALVFAPNGKKVLVNYGETRGYILERKRYDKWLAEEAARAGARVQSKTEVVNVLKKDDYVSGVEAVFEDEKFSMDAKVVVASDGVESRVARMAGMNTANKPVNIDTGFQFEMVDIKLEDPHKLEIYMGNEIAPRGYIWVFPKGEDKANVGIGIGGQGYEKTAFRLLSDFVSKSNNLKHGSITEVNAGGIPVGGFLENMVMNGLVVVGDAAHQVNPIHGGGLKEAAVAGRIAGEVIASSIHEGDFSEKALSKYNELWWEERGKYLKNVEKLREVVEKVSDDDLNILAEALEGDDLVEFTRGNRLSKLGGILMKNPKLIMLARHLL